MRAFIALVILSLFTAGAAAQSCAALKSQLATAKAGKPNKAIVARLQRKSRAYNCSGRVKKGREKACRSINAQMRQAKSGVVNRSRVRRLQKQIASHCGANSGYAWRGNKRKGTRKSAKGDRRNIFSAIFGRGDREVEVASVNPRSRRGVERVDLNAARKSARKSNSAYGTLATNGRRGRKGSSRVGSSRTMCVRLCDGFYFPINSSSHSDNYYDELAMCVGRCPGADVSLYVHPQGAPVEQMRSTMTGEAYVNLPTAFDYRKKLQPGCGCTNGTRIVRGLDEPPTLNVASASEAQRAATEAGKTNARWTPMRAVYDSTGKPLVPSITAYGAAPTTTTQFAAASRSGEPSVAAPASVPSATQTAAVAPKAVIVGEFDPDDHSVREVGPQFYSQTVAAFRASKSRSLEKRKAINGGVPTVITVTPLPSGESAAVTPAPEPELDEGDVVPKGTSAMVIPAASSGG